MILAQTTVPNWAIGAVATVVAIGVILAAVSKYIVPRLTTLLEQLQQKYNDLFGKVQNLQDTAHEAKGKAEAAQQTATVADVKADLAGTRAANATRNTVIAAALAAPQNGANTVEAIQKAFEQANTATTPETPCPPSAPGTPPQP
jgi:translation initiation factor 2 alpha subunit (eIF-2alpha)